MAFWVLQAIAQPPKGCQTDIRKAILYPEQVGCLKVAASGNEAMRLVANLDRMVNLTHLTLQGDWDRQTGEKLLQELVRHPRIQFLCLEDNDLTRAPSGLSDLQGLRELMVVGNASLNYKQLVASLAELPRLEALMLEENHLRQLPVNLSELQSLRRVYIKGNESLDFESAIERLSELPRLTEVHLPINQITNLPPNIGQLSHLRVLDLRDNILTGLNENLVSLTDLDTLQIEGNIIVEPVSELSKAGGLDIRYLSLDQGLTAADRERLKILFPNATIVENKTTAQPIATFRGASETLEAPSIIHLETDELRILSRAYLHYARIFNQRKFVYQFDSSLFEERYLDTSYANVRKRQAGEQYNNIALEGHRMGNRKEAWFDFKRSGEAAWNVYLRTNNPEVNAFLGMKWVYAGPLSPHEFRRKYLRKRYWTDVRIFFNEAANNFTIELKHAGGFDQIIARPQFYDKSLPLEKSQRTYVRRYERYEMLLQRRGERFQQNLLRDHRLYNLAYREKWNYAWKSFRQTYFSKAEKAMSQEQWLVYYDQVIAREKEALNNAKADRVSLMRRLELAGYCQVSETSDAFWQGVDRVECAFVYEDSSRIPETTVLLVDQGTRQVRICEGNWGISAIPTYIGNAAQSAIIVIARNGDIGLMCSPQLAQKDLSSPGCHTLFLQKFQGELTAVGDVWQALGWSR